jgi:hypothetical protein
VPDNPRGIVVFAHGSGSGKHSARNRHVAGILNDADLETLLFDLLTSEEELNRANVFDIGLLAGRACPGRAGRGRSLVRRSRWRGGRLAVRIYGSAQGRGTTGFAGACRG